MIFGFTARQFRPYEQEAEFARVNGFEFLQIWYDKNGIFSKGVIKEKLKDVMTVEMECSAFSAVVEFRNVMEGHAGAAKHRLEREYKWTIVFAMPTSMMPKH